VSGYDELAKLFRTLPSSDDREYDKYAHLMKKIATDANAAAQDSGLSAVNMFLQNADVAGRFVAPSPPTHTHTHTRTFD